jgi:hypothetical protein
MYHHSVFDVIIKEYHPDTSKYIREMVKVKDTLYDWFMAWLFKKLKIKVSSYPIVKGHNFKSTVAV